MLLHFRERKTRRPYTVVVGQRTIEGKLATLTNGPWRVNFRGGAPVDVTLKGEHRGGYAELVKDPEEVARVYVNLIDEYGYEKAGRHLGIRINVNRKPTHEELVDAIKRSGLSFITSTSARRTVRSGTLGQATK